MPLDSSISGLPDGSGVIAPSDLTVFDDLSAGTTKGATIQAVARAGLGYAEGTWVPVLTSDGGGDTIPTFTNIVNGTWTRIGRLVFFNLLFENLAGGVRGVGAGQLSVSLPPGFVVSADQNDIRYPAGTGVDGPDEMLLWAKFLSGETKLPLWRLTGSDLVTNSPVDYNNATDSRRISLTGRVIVD